MAAAEAYPPPAAEHGSHNARPPRGRRPRPPVHPRPREGGFDPAQQLDFLSRHEVTNVFGTPTAIRSMMRIADAGKRYPQKFRIVCAAGEPLNPEAIRWFKDQFGVTVLDYYGLTESYPLCGYYWYEGRADDVIISAGYRIGPFEVESACLEHPAVAEAAAVAVPDERLPKTLTGKIRRIELRQREAEAKAKAKA